MLLENPYHILIVDDNHCFVDALEALIVDVAGGAIKRIDKAYNGVDGLHLIRANRYQFIFMDINLPGMNGAEVTRKADRELFLRGLNIIAISYHTEFEFMKEMLEAGARRYLSKDQINHDTISEIFDAQHNQ